jgi:hypothetical protein
VFYGFTHQRSITATQKAAAAKRDYEHKQSLIEQAKAEYAKQKNPAVAKADTGGTCNSIGWKELSEGNIRTALLADHLSNLNDAGN